MFDTPLLACVIAIEFVPADPPERRCLSPSDAGQLAAHVMADLAERLPQIDRCGLALSAALYDATEILQPGWPLFHHLDGHYRSKVGVLPRLLALGASEGRMPGALHPDPHRAGAPLVFLPFVLMAPVAASTELHSVSTVLSSAFSPSHATQQRLDPLALGEVLEEVLVASGQLGANSALGLQTLFGLRLIHAQYMTRLDLCALMAAQLDPLGLAPLWGLLETGLLTPDDEQRVEDGHGGTWHWRRRRVESTFSGYTDWLNSESGQTALTGGRVAQAFADALRVQRQYLTLLQAHGVVVNWPGEHQEALIERLAAGEPERIHAVRLPGLGLAALIAMQGDSIVIIGYPFSEVGRGTLAHAFEGLRDGEALGVWPVDAKTGRFRL